MKPEPLLLAQKEQIQLQWPIKSIFDKTVVVTWAPMYSGLQKVRPWTQDESMLLFCTSAWASGVEDVHVEMHSSDQLD